MADKEKMIGQQSRTQSPTFISLPGDMIVEILQLIGAKSLKDLFSVKILCKNVLELCEDGRIYKVVELSRFKGKMRTTKEEQRFLDMCYHHGNPEAVYNKGVQDYFVNNDVDEGICKLKHAADGRYDRAVYVYAMLQRTRGKVEESRNYIKLLTRNEIREVRYQVMNEPNHGWEEELLPNEFLIKRLAYDPMGIVLGCYCKDLEDQNARRKKQKVRVIGGGWDDKNMCDECFWHLEHSLFLQHFPKHISFWET